MSNIGRTNNIDNVDNDLKSHLGGIIYLATLLGEMIEPLNQGLVARAGMHDTHI